MNAEYILFQLLAEQNELQKQRNDLLEKICDVLNKIYGGMP